MDFLVILEAQEASAELVGQADLVVQARPEAMEHLVIQVVQVVQLFWPTMLLTSKFFLEIQTLLQVAQVAPAAQEV